jgi:hypothetical protein
MDAIQLEFYIKQATKVFVWLQLSETRGFYIKTTKSALFEYLSSTEPFNDELFVEFGEENQELYLGRPEEKLL